MSNVTKKQAVANTLKKVKFNFMDAYGMIPASKQLDFRDGLMKMCGWETFKTFHSKRKGEVKINKLEIPVIEEAFAEYNINAWTGEYIKSLSEL